MRFISQAFSRRVDFKIVMTECIESRIVEMETLSPVVTTPANKIVLQMRCYCEKVSRETTRCTKNVHLVETLLHCLIAALHEFGRTGKGCHTVAA